MLTEIAARGTGGFVEDQLARTTPDPQAEALLGGFRLLGMGRKATHDTLRGIDDNGALETELTHMNLLRAVHSEHQLFEMVCHMWMDHFNIHLFGEARIEHLMIDYQENVIRPNAMGTFRDLLVATANSPAMLAYLNNDTSNANSPQGVNENYGRELLELHSLGIDENGNQVYTEADVRNASLAMSGWSIVNDPAAADHTDFVFRSDYHHPEEVSILSGAWTSAGTDGKATGDSLLQFLVTHPSTARYVALIMCRRFVSDQPPATLVDATAAAYLAADTDIVATLRHVLTSAEFAAAESQKLRRPFEAVAAMLRSLGSDVPTSPRSDSAQRLHRRLAQMQNTPWGWDMPNGYPDDAQHWLNSAGLLNRWNLGVRLARNVENGNGDDDRIQTSYGTLRPAAATAGDLIALLGAQLGVGTPPQAAIDAVAAAANVDPPGQAGSVNDEQLADIAGLLMAHPLFQTR